MIATARDHPERLADLASRGAQVVSGIDAGDAAAVQALLGAHRIGTAVLTPILTVSAPMASALAAAGVRRAVFLSSNNVAIDPDEPVYAALRAAEAQVWSALPEATILRPTMIYGHREDGNLARLMRAMRRWRLAPVPGDGRALQQPVHAGDVGRAAAAALGDASCAGAAFALGGVQTLTLAALYRACARAVGGPVWTPHMPIGLLSRMGRYAGLKAAQFDRIGRDKTAQGPAPPSALAPRMPLDQGLAQLARELSDP